MEIHRRLLEKMSKFFRRIILCGCSSRSGLDGQTFVVDESVVDDGPKSVVEFLTSDQQPEGVATHFDLSSIKFIDDEETDDDANETLENGRILVRVRREFVKFYLTLLSMALDHLLSEFYFMSLLTIVRENFAEYLLSIYFVRSMGNLICSIQLE